MAQADLLTIVIQWHAHPSTVEEWEGFAAEVKARLSGPDIQVMRARGRVYDRAVLTFDGCGGSASPLFGGLCWSAGARINHIWNISNVPRAFTEHPSRRASDSAWQLLARCSVRCS